MRQRLGEHLLATGRSLLGPGPVVPEALLPEVETTAVKELLVTRDRPVPNLPDTPPVDSAVTLYVPPEDTGKGGNELCVGSVYGVQIDEVTSRRLLESSPGTRGRCDIPTMLVLY